MDVVEASVEVLRVVERRIRAEKQPEKRGHEGHQPKVAAEPAQAVRELVLVVRNRAQGDPLRREGGTEALGQAPVVNLAQRRAVRGAGVGLGGRALGDHGLAADHGRLVVDRTRLQDGLANSVGVVTVDIAHGHKTGTYLDQRDNRQRFADWVRQFGCRRVLNCYSYTGAFSVAALAGDIVERDRAAAPALV